MSERQKKIKRLVQQFKKDRTANEAISRSFANDVRAQCAIDKGWKYYVHLNKLIAPMSRSGIIIQTGTKIGPTHKEEKIWAANTVERRG